jgi:FxsC-like protein
VALFVLSYARRDGEPLIRKFFNALCEELSPLHPLYPPPTEVGFMDTLNTQHGESWSQILSREFCSARVLVPVYSPRFFYSEECGREVQAFLERGRAFTRDIQHELWPRCILPVVWIWEDLEAYLSHPILKTVSYGNKNYPQAYLDKKQDLKMLVKSGSRPLHSLIRPLALNIHRAIQLAAADPLPSLDPIRWDELPNAFDIERPRAISKGPRCVQFAYLAPTLDRLPEGRKSLSNYGVRVRDWKAFDPECPTSIGSLSDSIATDMNLSIDHNSIDLNKFEPPKKIVVFVVDSWAAKVGGYAPILQKLDEAKYHAHPVLIPLNAKDPENQQRRGELVEDLRRLLPRRSAEKNVFLGGIADENEYETSLRKVLATRQSQIINSADGGDDASSMPVI